MKYTGTITWLCHPPADIKNIGKESVWSFAGITAFDRGQGLWNASFVTEGYTYELTLYQKKKGFFEGNFKVLGEVQGVTYLWLFQKDEELLFRGNWEEPSYQFPNYEVYIHLLPQELENTPPLLR